jgi:hypothetical protein
MPKGVEGFSAGRKRRFLAITIYGEQSRWVGAAWHRCNWPARVMVSRGPEDWREPSLLGMADENIKVGSRETAARLRHTLFFNDDDISSTITLSRAAFRLLWDIYPAIATDGFEKPLSKVIEVLGWPKFNAITNFLKHADKDPEAQMQPDEIHARTGIGLSIILYGRATDYAYSPEMRAWEALMTLAEPEVWDAHPDRDHEGYEDFKRAVERYEVSTREERLAMGRSFLRGFKLVGRGERPI